MVDVDDNADAVDLAPVRDTAAAAGAYRCSRGSPQQRETDSWADPDEWSCETGSTGVVSRERDEGMPVSKAARGSRCIIVHSLEEKRCCCCSSRYRFAVMLCALCLCEAMAFCQLQQRRLPGDLQITRVFCPTLRPWAVAPWDAPVPWRSMHAKNYRDGLEAAIWSMIGSFLSLSQHIQTMEA